VALCHYSHSDDIFNLFNEEIFFSASETDFKIVIIIRSTICARKVCITLILSMNFHRRRKNHVDSPKIITIGPNSSPSHRHHAQ
jgi:hypothetical protein